MFAYMNMNMTLFHGLTMFIFWFVLFYILFSIFRDKEDKEESALNILKKRYSKGEISKEQFEEMKKTIQ